MNLDKHFSITNKIFLFLLFVLLFFSDAWFFVLIYISLFVFATLRTVMMSEDKKTKSAIITSYAVVTILQLRAVYVILFNHNSFDYFFGRFIGVIIMPIPLVVSRYIMAGKYAHFYLPSAGESVTIGMYNMLDIFNRIKKLQTKVGDTHQKINKENILTIIEEIKRNNSFTYINNGSLTESYFEKANASLEDPNIYLIISRTGSPVSEVISVFTKKMYNHASLSFDKDLQTAISYNGGERVYPPGLNSEMIEFFNKSDDASIIVYSLPCSTEVKQKILDEIARINREGSAYNVLGLVVNRSYKPNIMFCSQFIYNILKESGLVYFDKADGKVTPTDLIELDYYRKLKFEWEIKF